MEEHRHLLKTRLSNVLRTTSAHITELKGLGVYTVDDFSKKTTGSLSGKVS